MLHPTTDRWTAVLDKHRWAIFVLPLLVFMLVGTLEPTPEHPGGQSIGLSIGYGWYPWLYGVKIALTLVAMALVWPGYREFPLRVGPLALFVGLIGGPLWIGLCHFDLEHRYLLPLLDRIGAGGLIGTGTRAAFNPFEQLGDRPALAWAFLVLRFVGLVAVVPVIEEFFLRGFLMRIVMEGDWWRVPFGTANRLALVVGTAVPMLMHPGELLAALVWFSMITWLMLRTRNIWDCVAAHAVTNLILGVYVVATGAWRLM